MHKLDYPINVARVIARTSASTQFVLASDIELYPSPGLATGFIQMLREKSSERKSFSRYDQSTLGPKTAYVVPVFEMNSQESMPNNKSELKTSIMNEKLFIFHHEFCLACHKIPGYSQWLSQTSN